jgi:undecaprenyl-diphosphatase
MLRRELLRKEVSRRLSRRLGFVLTVELVLGLLLSVGVIWLFAQIVEEVVDGESRWFDEAVLLWINDNFPVWFDRPMLLATALSYYLVILPLLAVVTYAFYRTGAKISATLLPVTTLGSMILTEVLKRIFQRARPELFDSGYYASGYSFPSGHATLAVVFYGTLVLLLAWRLEGF